MTNNKKEKKIGQVFTPKYLVENMLDYIGYIGSSILKKHIIDNSCGDGAFLKSIVERYCDESIKAGVGINDIKKELEIYIHGIDIDEIAYQQCIYNLNQVVEKIGIEDVNWDLYNQSSLSMTKFNNRMDYVIGNPPYVRVHNLESAYDEVKQFKFANGGMTDLYLVFFELGFNMLNDSGKLCYITPGSWLNSLAAHNMREYIIQEQNLVSLIDLGHFQPFEKITSYTIISLFSKDKKDKIFEYYTYDGQQHCRIFCDRISLDDCYIDSYFYLSDRDGLNMLRDIKMKKYPNYVTVKNGFATLADSVFIGNEIPESNITIRTLKASTGKWYNCLYPYDHKGKLLPPNIALSNSKVREHFDKHKTDLLKGRDEYPTFYEFGRTQALLDVWKDKIAINTLLRTEKDLKIEKVDAGCGIYSGLYIISEFDISYEIIRSILISEEFAKYISLLKKYKSGGYYTFNSKDVQQYINYRINLANHNSEIK